ncbi:prolyl oligopeptidase family serine peptidase [Rummeliibacillus pycnus]|uniref:prolyl oligopeptidase family serine peptidase n=1 Tax=Rummeliibacillus pycnus TaxID=101070 RepID=UPI0037CC597F
MKVDHETWGNIPLLHIYNEETVSAESPVVIFLHGFQSAKEHNLHYAYQLVNKGVRVLMPDALLHGDREESLDSIQLSLRFWEVVLTSIEEVNFLYEKLKEKGLLATDRIGVSGTSMGAITTMGCLKVYPWIKTSAVMMGAPAYVELAKGQLAEIQEKGFKIPLTDVELDKMLTTLSYFDMSKHPETMAGRPVLFWHGKKDHMVPFAPTYAFYESIQQDYAEHPENISFIVDKTAGHKVSRPAMLAGTQWLADHLA